MYVAGLDLMEKNILGFRNMTHEEKIKCCTSVRCEHSEMSVSDRQGGQGPFENRLGLQATKDLEDLLAEAVPHLSIHKVSSQVATLMTSSCSAHTHSLPLPFLGSAGLAFFGRAQGQVAGTYQGDTGTGSD